MTQDTKHLTGKLALVTGAYPTTLTDVTEKDRAAGLALVASR